MSRSNWVFNGIFAGCLFFRFSLPLFSQNAPIELNPPVLPKILRLISVSPNSGTANTVIPTTDKFVYSPSYAPYPSLIQINNPTDYNQKNGYFYKGIPLKPSLNPFMIVATNNIGKSIKKYLTIFKSDSSSRPTLSHAKSADNPLIVAQILNQTKTKENQELVDASTKALQFEYTRMGWKPSTLPITEQETIFKETSSAILLMQLGTDYYYKNDFQHALISYKKAAEILPKFPYIYVRLGSIYYKIGDFSNARLAWEKALKLNPNYPDIRRYLDTLNNDIHPPK